MRKKKKNLPKVSPEMFGPKKYSFKASEFSGMGANFRILLHRSFTTIFFEFLISYAKGK